MSSNIVLYLNPVIVVVVVVVVVDFSVCYILVVAVTNDLQLYCVVQAEELSSVKSLISRIAKASSTEWLSETQINVDVHT
jgi:hypothetical protein